jgi:hypothetical protein
MQKLTPTEEKLLTELTRLAGSSRVITGRQLRDRNFADFVADLYQADVAYPQSLQSRKLQILRDKEYITMRNGVYTLLR